MTDANQSDAVVVPEGWIKHDGGPCPVPLDTLVDVICRDGYRFGRYAPAGVWILHCGEDFWTHKPKAPDADIIAYKPEPSAGGEKR